MSSGSPPTLWCDLMVAASLGARLDDVGVQGALDEEAGVRRRRAATSSKTRMKVSPMALRLASGSVTPSRTPEEAVGRLHVDEVDVELAAEGLLDLVGLARAHEPGVDEDTGELVADGPVHEGGGHGRVDATGQGAQHPARCPPGPGRPRPRTR